MINNSTASSNDVDDGQADEPANILEATDSGKELEKERQEQSASGKHEWELSQQFQSINIK